jgi:hypothetical protein
MWFPIESAPKGGTYVLVSDGVEVEKAKFHEWEHFFTEQKIRGWVLNWNTEYGCPDEWMTATHWQPLPEPPQ